MLSRLTSRLNQPAVVAATTVLILRGLTLGSRFLLSLLLARMLSPSDMGEYGLITAVLALALLALGLEFYSYMYREMVPASPERRAQIIADQLALGGVSLLVVACLSAFAAIAGFFPARLVLWFLVILTTEHLSLEATRFLIITSRPVPAYIGVFLRGGIWVYALAALMFAIPSTRTLQTVLVWWALGGVASLVFAAAALSGLPWHRLRRRRPDWTWIFAGLRTARPFMLTAGGALVISYVDRFVIDEFVGRSALGIYTFYSTILIGLLSLGGSMSHQFLPKVIAGHAAGKDDYRSALRTFLGSMLGLASIATMTSGLLMAPMLAALGLTVYGASVGVFYAMLPGIFLRMLADVPSYALYAARRDGYLLGCNLGSAGVSTVLNLILVPRLGIYGAALAGGVASAVLFLSLAALAVRNMRGEAEKPAASDSVGLPTDSDMLYP